MLSQLSQPTKNMTGTLPDTAFGRVMQVFAAMIGNPIVKHGSVLKMFTRPRLGGRWCDKAAPENGDEEEDEKIANTPHRAHDGSPRET
jgi:hypothetical protein